MQTKQSPPKVVYLTAGAGGMFCGSCMHDNALSSSLQDYGWDVSLLAAYTPIRTDEHDVSVDHVFFGGINVFLQQKIPLFRYLPPALDRFLDSPKLIRRVTAKAMDTDAKTLGTLAVSMLKGIDGNQRKEVGRICDWLELTRPDMMIFSNVLIGGCIEEIKRRLNIPIVVTLQGDDVFLDSLEEPYRQQALDRIAQIGDHVDLFLVHTNFYRNYISEHLGLEKSKFRIAPLGLKLEDFQPFRELADSRQQQNQRVIGYLARLAPEKGLHHLVDAFIDLKSNPGFDDVRLKVAGWLSPQNKDYAEGCFDRLRKAGLDDAFEYQGAIEREQKLDFLKSIDVFCVPADFLEPKGIYALEAMAAGVPVVAPDHGAFPEMATETRGIVLFPARNPAALSTALQGLLLDRTGQIQIGQHGQASVFAKRNPLAMAKATVDILQTLLPAAV